MRHALTRLSSGRLSCRPAPRAAALVRIHLQALPAASAWTPRPSKVGQTLGCDVLRHAAGC